MDANKIKISNGQISFCNTDNLQLATLKVDHMGNIIVSPQVKIRNVLDPVDNNDVANKFYVDAAIHNYSINNPQIVDKEQLGLKYVQNIKYNLEGSAPPGQENNLNEGYTAGSRWLDTVNKMEYICFSSTEDSADWVNINIADTNFQEIYDYMTNQTGRLDDSITTDTNCWSAVKIAQHVSSHSDDTDNPHRVTKSQIGLGNVANTKNNFSAERDPKKTDDSFLGYSIGSRWTNTVSKKEFICVNPKLGKAEWKLTTTEPGETNTGLNIGTGAGIAAGKLDDKIKMKSIVGGNLVDITSTDNEIVVDTKNSHSFMMAYIPIDASTDLYKNILYFPWVSSEFQQLKNGKVAFKVHIEDRELDIRAYNSEEKSVLGEFHASETGYFSFSLASPSYDTSIVIQIKKNSSGGTDPRIYGIVLKFES